MIETEYEEYTETHRRRRERKVIKGRIESNRNREKVTRENT